MLNEKQKEAVVNRLRRVEGQISGISKMVGEDRYCMDILTQTRAVTSALRKVEDLIMEQHLHTCVLDSMQSDDRNDQEDKINELMDVLAKFRKIG